VPPVSDPTSQRLADQFRTVLWLAWQTRRWRPPYRSAVEQFLRDLQQDLAELTSQQQALQERGKAWLTSQIPDIDTFVTTDMEIRDRLAACRRVLQTYRQIKRYLRQFGADLIPAERHALDDSRGDKYAVLNHTVMDMIAPCLAQDILDQVPALAKFVKAGALRFPLPPRLPWVIEEVCRDLVPVRVVGFDDMRHEVHIALKTDTSFPQPLVTDLLDLISSAYNPKQRSRWGSASVRRRIQPLTHYRDVFRAYDLRKRGASLATIAEEIWPDDFATGQRAYPEKNPTIQRAYDHVKQAEDLIHAASS
jgi:uncharacterized membrane protein